MQKWTSELSQLLLRISLLKPSAPVRKGQKTKTGIEENVVTKLSLNVTVHSQASIVDFLA